MRPGRSLADWLGDIVTWGEKLARHLEDMDRAAFPADEKTQDAAAKCAEAIGAAAKEALQIEPDFEKMHPGTRLAAAYAARNRLSHGYFSIDVDVLWVTVSQSIPSTVAAVERALSRLR